VFGPFMRRFVVISFLPEKLSELSPPLQIFAGFIFLSGNTIVSRLLV